MSIAIASADTMGYNMRTRKVIVVWGVVGAEAQEKEFRTIREAVKFAEDIAKAFGLPTGFSELRSRHCTAVGHKDSVYHVKVYKVMV